MQVGLYGKLPSHGDFLRRRTSDAFVATWDAWLQDCMAASRSILGDRWLDVYLTSPVWRFAGAAGITGPSPIMGLLVPSVDRVGRYFPLTVVAELPADTMVVAAATAAATFFDRAERLVIETLEAELVDFERFDERLARLADDLGMLTVPPKLKLDPAAAAVLNGDAQSAWEVPIGSVDHLRPALEQLLAHKLSITYRPLMLWWSAGSSIVEPGCLIGRGLPHPQTFAALLDGSWQRHGWRPVPASVERETLPGLLVEEPALSFRSAGASDVGKVRQVNQDAFIERPEVGLWAVADGLGGHSDGELASRMVCDALADFTPNQSFEDSIAAMRGRLQEVNDHLLLGAARSLLGERSGSTVVALLVRGTRCAVLWAGDSRVYRWREGRLAQLTRDHSPAEVGGAAGRRESFAVTRAVGAQSTLDLDLHSDNVLPGDRFLLCSDGLTRAVPEPQIQAFLAGREIRASVDGLIQATLAAGAPDNVTAVVVEAYEFP